MGEAKRCVLGVGDIGFFFVTNTGQLLLIKWAQLAWIATLKFMYVIQFPQKYIKNSAELQSQQKFTTTTSSLEIRIA